MNIIETIIVGAASELALSYIECEEADRSIDCGEWSDAHRSEQPKEVDAAFDVLYNAELCWAEGEPWGTLREMTAAELAEDAYIRAMNTGDVQ